MNQITAGLIAGLIGGLIVLLIGLMQNKKNKLKGEIKEGKEWNKLLMTMMFIITGILPFAGLIMGIVGLSFQSKRKQGLFLMFFTVGVIAMYILEKSAWGLIFGILIAIFYSIYMRKYTLKSIGLAILIFIIIAICYDVLIHTNYFRNNVTWPLGFEHPH